MCNLQLGSQNADFLRDVRVIIWDEICNSNGFDIEEVDRMLRCKKWVRTGGSFSMSSLGPRDLPLSLAAHPRSFGRTALRVVGPTVSAPVQVPRTPRKLPPNCGE